MCKKSKSKITAVLLCALLCVMSLGGCGSSDSSEKKDIVKTETTDGDTKAAAESVDSGNVSEENPQTDDEAGKEASESGENDTETASSSAVTIEEQVLVDQDDVKVTAKEYTTDSVWGDGIKILVENNSNRDIMLSCDALIVNDFMITDLFASQVAAGKKSNETIYLSSAALEAAGIDTVGQIELYFRASDASSYEEIFTTDCVTIQTSAYDQMDTTANDEGTELYNEDGIRIIGKTVDENSFWGTAILLYIENNSGRNVGISVEDLSINGFMLTPYFSTTVYDGKKSVDEITLLSTELEENEITSIDEVELKFHFYDNGSYETIADSDVITFSAK